MSEKITEQESESQKKSRILWTVLFIIIAVLSVYAVISLNKNFSFEQFYSYIKTSSKPYLACAVLCSLGYICFEAFSLMILCRAFGYKRNFFSGVSYAAGDIYFSAITPSATGGQPASAYFMLKDNLPSMLVPIILLANLIIHFSSVAVIGIVCIIIKPSLLAHFDLFAMSLLVLGIVFQFGLALLSLLAIVKNGWISNIGHKTISFLAKIHLVKNKAAMDEKLDNKLNEYGDFAKKIKGKRNALIAISVTNLIQRICQIAVTVFTFLATGGNAASCFDVFALQILVTISGYCVPIPGSMGISDYLFLSVFNNVMPATQVANLELLSRAISFYVCIFVSGFIVILSKIIFDRRAKKNNQ